MNSEKHDIQHSDGSVEKVSFECRGGILTIECEGNRVLLTSDAALKLMDFLLLNAERLRRSGS